jgi:glutamate-1-semialdehyde 2,1-aminomutase
MSERYILSEAMLERALRTIPLGSQTFSKSKTQFPQGVSPFFISKGKGSHVWDVDGNEYTDFINSQASITLGYNDPDVTSAVQGQLEDGVIFSLPHPVETEVAETLVEMVPCAEMVRFGKNGSDATAGAIRLARAYTGRDHVAVCGYHGWQDWYIGSTMRNLGVPQTVQDLTHSFKYNDIDSLHQLFQQYPDQIAAVILEPMNVIEPQDGFLQEIQQMAKRYGAVLIFDETITGFRYSNGGAQELFGVTPDLACFGKGMANGYPVSAVAGKTDIMRLMEEIFFSFTFGGETLSLQASLATMRKLKRVPVVDYLYSQGKRVMTSTQKLITTYQLDSVLSVSGHPSWSFLLFQDTARYTSWQIKTLFLQEVFARGILAYGTHNMSYAHNDKDVDRLLIVYDEVFAILSDAVNSNSLERILKCEPLVPLFRLR